MSDTAIVTGGAGFIGSHLVDALLDRGRRVVVIDDLSSGRRENLDIALARGAVLRELDVRDTAAVREALRVARPGVVFHLAAQVSVTRSVSEVEYDADVNVRGTATVLEAARRAGVGRVVNVSTGGALYGDVDRVPTPEDAPICPVSPYGQSKWAAELYCDLYARLHGLSTVSLRLANIYGPRQDPRGEAGVVAIFSDGLLTGRRPTVYGDGHQTRDYTFVADVVAACLSAADAGTTGAVNIGSGVETSVLDLIEALRRLDGADGLDPRHAPQRPGEARRSCLDSSRAERELGWRAETELAEGLRATVASFRRERDGQEPVERR